MTFEFLALFQINFSSSSKCTGNRKCQAVKYTTASLISSNFVAGVELQIHA